MPDEKRDAAEKILDGIGDQRSKSGGTCRGCDYEAADSDFFECEACGAPICTYCHNMTLDGDLICRDCVKAQDLTPDDVMFEEDGQGRPFF